MNAALVWKIAEPIIDKLMGHWGGSKRFKEKFKLQLLENENETIKLARDWLRADTDGAWYQKAWRPALMFTCIGVIVLYLIIDPVIGLVFGVRLPEPQLSSIPEPVWELLKVAFGIYIGGRTVEKTVKYRQTQVPSEPRQYEAVEYDLHDVKE